MAHDGWGVFDPNRPRRPHATTAGLHTAADCVDGDDDDDGMFGGGKVLPTSYTLNLKYTLDAAAGRGRSRRPLCSQPPTGTTHRYHAQVPPHSQVNNPEDKRSPDSVHVFHVDVSTLSAGPCPFEVSRSGLEHDGSGCEAPKFSKSW